MFWTKDNAPTEWVIGVFCEVFSAADAVRALNASGFEDDDIELIGVLSGRAPDLEMVLLGMGIPASHADYCNACFEHGAVLVSVRTLPTHRRKIALKLLKQHGGTLPTES
jgi:hypothetical protein